MTRLNKTESAIFLYCRFSLFQKDPFFLDYCDTNNKFIIFSGSLLVLKAMNHTSSRNPQIQKLLEKSHKALANKEIVLCWIPCHIGITGNEMVNQQAKMSLSLEPTSFKI